MSWFTRKKLGIDLGTANTLVFTPGKGVIVVEPSVVAISEIDYEILAIGSDAKDMIGKTPDNVLAYRPLRDGVIADYRVTEAMLKYYTKRALGDFVLRKPEMLISVPAGVTSTERRAVIEAALKAGAHAAYVIKEPILAALGADIPIYDAEGHMVVDLGGGTSDVAVISLGGIVASRSVKYAGDKLDQAIIDYVKKQYNLAIGDQTAERVKIKIGTAVSVTEEDEILIKGRDYVTGLPRSIRLRSNETAEAVDAVLGHVIRAVKEVLGQTPPELASDILDNGITLTGGSAQLKNLGELIYRRTGVKATVAKEPFYCVVRGAGIALDHLDTYKKMVSQK